MKAILKKFQKIPERLMEGEISVVDWFLGFSGIIAVRELIKSFLATPGLSLLEVVTDYLHELLFFAITFLLVWLFLSFVLKISVKRLSKAFFWASWIIIFPPVIDMLKTGGGIYWSFYLLGTPSELWREFASLFGNFPSGIVYFGTKIMIFFVVILAGLLAYWHSKKLFKGVFAALGTYVIFFFMAALPAFIGFAYFSATKNMAQISAIDQIQLFGGMPRIFGLPFDGLKYSMAYNLDLLFYPLFIGLLAVFFFVANGKKFMAVVENMRLPQIIYHFGLLFIGMGLGFLAYPNNFDINIFSVSAVVVLLISILLAWKASVVVNDIFDFETDRISNSWRPLPKGIFSEKEYKHLGYAFFSLSLLGGLVVGFKFMAILGIYQFLAWAYSANPYRLKKFPVVATAISAAASILILFMGFALFSGDYNAQGLSWRIILLFLIALTLSLPIKDFKDIEGDRKYGTWTIPVIFGEEKSRLIVAINIFISFMLSVFFLNEFRLFWWALLFGIMAYLIVVKKKPSQLFWWVGCVVVLYLLVIIRTVFLN